MKRILFLICAFGLFLSCQSKYYVSDYQARMEANDEALKPFMTLPEGITAQERDALQFLYAYMPLADVTDYTAEFYLANVRKSLQAREEMSWKAPEREFRHFVLPLRTKVTTHVLPLPQRLKGFPLLPDAQPLGHCIG